MPSWEIYDLIEDKLKSFTRSAVRTKVLLCLMEREMNGGDLEKAIGIRASTVLHSIKEMIDSGLVVRQIKGYAPTNAGRMQALILDDLMSTLLSLNQNRSFWLNHNLSDLPVNLQKEIGLLYSENQVKTDPSLPLKGQDFLIRSIAGAKRVIGIISVVPPGYLEALSLAVEKGALVDLIVTRPLATSIEKSPLADLLGRDNLRLYRSLYDLKLSFSVVDNTLFLGLYRLDGSYDLENLLICSGFGPVKWGAKLFAHYAHTSKLWEKIDS